MNVSPSTSTTSDLFQLSACELARRIAAGEVSAREVVAAHVARCEAVHPLVNAVVVPLYEAALVAASEADERQARGEPLGPLHGVPLTIKDCFHIAQTEATIGVTTRIGKLSSFDAPQVAALKAAGAIVLGKTNVPQLMLLHESDNPVYGRTNNPWTLARTCGGSSGGEAAIIAAGGSPCGIGSDMGGSIRLPAHFCGISGFKPSSHRLTKQGSVKTLRGLEALQWQPGPLARRVEDLELLLAILAGDPTSSHSPQLSPAPLRAARDVVLHGLRIGFWEDNGQFPYAPAVQRAVRQAVQALEAQGAIVEPFAPPKVSEAVYLYTALMAADGGADARRIAAGSKLTPGIAQLLWAARIPNWLRPLIAWGLVQNGASHRAGLVRAARARSADEFWQLTAQMEAYRQNFLADFSKYDALVLPPYALPAPRHGQAIDLIAAAGDALLINMLGLPSGVVPITRVQEDEESTRTASRELTARIAREAERESSGLPIGVQVVSHFWREDVALAVMQAIEGGCRDAADWPLTPVLPRAESQGE
jgi:fatty acid amide hydrolase